MPLVTNFIVRRCRTVELMMRYLPPVILANGRTHRPIFISWKRNVGPRNKIGSALGMPGRPFRRRRREQRSRISARDRCSTFYFLFYPGVIYFTRLAIVATRSNDPRHI